MQQKNHLKAFESHLLGLGKSRATVRTYNGCISVMLKFVDKQSNPTTITYEDVETYLKDMKSRLAKTSWRANVFAIKLWLTYLKSYHHNNTIDHFTNLPKEMNLLRPPKRREENPYRKVEILTKAEENKLYSVAKSNPRNYAMLRLFFITMQRSSSVLNINLGDIDFEEKEILIYAKGDEQYTVPIDEELIQAIRDYLKIRETPQEGFILDNWGRKRYHKDSLFLNGTGKRPSHNLPYNILKTYASQCHINKRIFLHLTRHSGITRCLARGVDPKTLATVTGHKTLEVLMRYNHPDEKEAKKRIVSILTTDDTQTAKSEELPIPPQAPNIEQLMKEIDALQSQVKSLQKFNS